MANKISSRFVHNLTKLFGNFGYKLVRLHLGTFLTSVCKPVHQFHADRLHHGAKWLLPCREQPGVQGFCDIRGIVAILSAWEVAIDSISRIGFTREPFHRFKIDCLELLEWFVKLAVCFCCHHFPEKGDKCGVLVGRFKIFLKMFEAITVRSEGKDGRYSFEKALGAI